MSAALRIRICIPRQSLTVLDEKGNRTRCYAVSTARNGAGEASGSNCTPRGRHIIRAKIGAGAPVNTVFRGRRPTGELWTPELAASSPGRDWILTRILWLSGTQPGRNRLGQVDTMRRYIYLHGSPDTVPMGSPGSIGCVRMRNDDIVDLFDLVRPYTRVDIDDFALEAGLWNGLFKAARSVREPVFVEEQGVPSDIELDENDAVSLHVLARDADGTPIGTGRLLPDGHIGRMAVLREWRGQGVGSALMERLLEEAKARGMAKLALNAQVQACRFYAGFGFAEVGNTFMEAGIAHQAMVRMD